MKQKELSEAIRQGINQSINDLCKQIFFGFIIAIGICIVIILVWYYLPLPQPEIVLSAPIYPCETETGKQVLTCYVINKTLEQKMIRNKSDGKRPIIATKSELCGYEEANAWFEQYKSKVGGNLYLECKRI